MTTFDFFNPDRENFGALSSSAGTCEGEGGGEGIGCASRQSPELDGVRGKFPRFSFEGDPGGDNNPNPVPLFGPLNNR